MSGCSFPSTLAVSRFVLFCALVALPTLAFAQAKVEEEPPLPKFVNMPIPSADELLRDKPVDWVILTNSDVLVVELVSPRPNALKLLQQQYDELLKSKPAGMDPEERRRKLHELQRLQVTLINGGEEPDYFVETRLIDRIMYFEDLVLKRASLLMDAGKLTAAYELLMFVERRHRGWPDFDTHYQRFLFLEGLRLLQAQQLEAALVQFERLFALNAKYPQLSEQLGNVTDRLMTVALQEDDFRRARHFLARLERHESDHVVVRRRRDQLTADAGNTLSAARAAFASAHYREAVDLADRASRIWPDLSGLKEAHRELALRYQVVHAGVVQLAGTPATCPGSADERQRLLSEIPLFEPDRLLDGVVRYRSSFIESWEPRDLGRELRFQLRPR